MTLDLLVDGVVAALLVATIGVATVLYVRLGRIRRIRGDMEALVHQLATAGEAAEASLRGFREMAESTGRDVEERVRSGQALREELSFLIDRASTLADRLAATPPAPGRPAQAAAAPVATSAARAARLVQAIRPRAKAGDQPAAGWEGAAPDAGIAHRPHEAEQALMRALESAR
ncbi:MAG: DUF6468 domain-containing protein [Alphaproteobacteria bacterium]